MQDWERDDMHETLSQLFAPSSLVGEIIRLEGTAA